MPFIPLLILSLSLSLSLRSQTLLFSLSHTSLAFSSHTLSLMVETHVLPLPSCTLSLNQCYGDSWCSLAMEESFYFCFWVWVSVCVWDCVPNIQGMFGRDPRAPPPLVPSTFLLFLCYFILFFLYFSFVLVLFGLGLGQFMD